MPSPYNTNTSSSSGSGSNGKRNVLIGSAIAAVLLLIVGIGWAVQANRDTTGDDAKTPGDSTSSGSTPSTTTSPSPGTSSTAPAKGAPAITDTYGLGVGDPDAPVKVEVFEDFQCPFCMQFEEASHEQLQQAAADGDAYLIYRPMAFINDYSGRALNAFGVVLDASGGEVALKFHDLLFANQPSESGPYPSDDDLIDLAVEAGADEGQIRRGVETSEFGQWAVNASDAASKRGVNSTPTVFVDGDPVTGNSIDELLANVMAGIDAG
ncbi:DsbA family protein [Nocardioides sp. Root151]|uniref:DsbA family protein n=1 Tax=Nocardioides sp. Root151 TaxID=1736475 RepID=UPI0007024223|nr:thioredoxin domain-containing protein [Nocardioides sp. Root151]KQZ67484.1 hypothetical protein ASD66_21360 [Nocardioides sp. Root151]